MRERFRRCRRAVEQRSLGGERLRDAADLVVRLLPVLLLDGLAHARDRLHTVARVEARRVQLVAEPGAPRQAFAAGQRARALDEQRVQRLRLGAGERLAAVHPRPRERLLVALGALRERVDRVVERGEVEVRRHLLRLRRYERLAGIRRGGGQPFLALAGSPPPPGLTGFL